MAHLLICRPGNGEQITTTCSLDRLGNQPESARRVDPESDDPRPEQCSAARAYPVGAADVDISGDFGRRGRPLHRNVRPYSVSGRSTVTVNTQATRVQTGKAARVTSHWTGVVRSGVAPRIRPCISPSTGRCVR